MKIYDVFTELGDTEALIVLKFLMQEEPLIKFLLDEKDLPRHIVKQLELVVAKYRAGCPISRILGFKGFWNSDFVVDYQVFVPRADSETIISSILWHCDNSQCYNILDLGTGTGCLICSLLQELSKAQGVAVDISAGALAVAKQNAESLGLLPRIHFIQSDWLKDVDINHELFDIVVSNPPYIRTKDICCLSCMVKFHDPFISLDGGIDGLDAYREIIFEGYKVLKDGGILALEHGYNQKADIINLVHSLKLCCFKQCFEYKDLNGNDRVLLFVK